MKSYKKLKKLKKNIKNIKKNKTKRRKYKGAGIVVCPFCNERNLGSVCVVSYDHGYYQDICTCKKCGRNFEFEGEVD
jgi:transcription elongation factor Elf1